MAGGAWAWLLLLCCCCGGSWTQQRQIFAAATTDANDRRLLETFLFWDCISSFQFCYFFPWLVCWILLLSCIGPRVMQGAELDSLGTLCVFLVISITFLSLYTSSVNYFFGATVQFGLVGSKAFWHMEMHLTPCSSFPLLRKLEVYKFQRKNDNFVGAC
jgi:hypothetical protein